MWCTTPSHWRRNSPPEKRLRSLHPLSALFELGIVSHPPVGKHVVCKHSIVPVAASKEFKVHGNDVHVPGVPFGEGWLWIEVSMPVVPGPEDDTRQGGKRIHHALPIMSHTSCQQPIVLWCPWLSCPTALKVSLNAYNTLVSVSEPDKKCMGLGA